ncbi:MAG: B12-binding domain-containing radical SAM protein [Thiolinea sp.]
MPVKPKVLIVNAYVHPWASATPTQLFIPRAMTPYYLAGQFNREQADIQVYDEVHHGALLDPGLFAWPDLVVFTGLTAAFDRARQLCAYFRHARPDVITVIGGPIPRALPVLCDSIFDYVCTGDVEALDQIIAETLGSHCLHEGIPVPRYDLLGFSYGVGYIETTRYCNFACSFCSLTGEKRKYASYSEESIKHQLEALPKTNVLMLLDNNFYGNHRGNFQERVHLLGDYWRRGKYRGWIALVTGDFFKKEANLSLVAENGCIGLFSGVESLDPEVLRNFNKHQSLLSDPKSLSLLCAKYGIVFDYGVIVDPAQQAIAEIDSQINALLADPAIPLPGLLSLTIPIVGTPYFEDAAQSGRLMPRLRISDLHGQKLVEWPKEPIEQVQPFIADLLRFRGRKTAMLKHTLQHTWLRRRSFNLQQLAFSFMRPVHNFGGTIRIGNLRQMRESWREPKLTYNAMTDGLGAMYRPLQPLPAKFTDYFKPLYVTNAEGGLTDEMINNQNPTVTEAPLLPMAV